MVSQSLAFRLETRFAHLLIPIWDQILKPLSGARLEPTELPLIGKSMPRLQPFVELFLIFNVQ